ncbi:MAG TPA: hypothetical protein VFR35_03755, partial [Actinoplanes sp.]|nr:hypothetical protein [Actinoplanes sp.]
TPVRLDRHGLLLRAAGQDVRLPFAEPLTCPGQLPGRMRELLARARAAAGPGDHLCACPRSDPPGQPAF